MHDLQEIKNTLHQQRDELRDTYNVSNLGIFGSVARGENTDTSDIDILVSFSKPVGMFKFIRLEDHLSKIFGRKVDLVTPRALKLLVKDEVLKDIVYV